MTTATMFEAKTNLSELVKKVQAGETVIITSGREKTPVVELKAIQPVASRRFGFLKHLNFDIPDSAFFDPLPEDELRLWNEGDPNDILYTSQTTPSAKCKVDSTARYACAHMGWTPRSYDFCKGPCPAL